MEYISTRGEAPAVSAATAIRQGIAPDGGLYVPANIPQISLAEIEELSRQDYQQRAGKILALYLTDYSEEELEQAVALAYNEEKFTPSPAPLVQLNKYNDREYMLELWHGPTAAFKDLALQLLPHLLAGAVQKTGEEATVGILAATSGDTGKAALEGFRDVANTAALVFFPHEGVSDMQKLQMVTQEGENCHVVAIKGNFDDAQAGVKEMFADTSLARELQEKGVVLSSANSINWGRLVAQIVYYFSAYADLIATEKIEAGEPVNFVVPTGNFGNILAAWYARSMGLPVGRLVCASNRNKVLADFMRKGHYDRRRELFKTNSPSMDILVSSNLERLLFELHGRQPDKIRELMAELAGTGHYKITGQALQLLQDVFVGGFADDGGTVKTIREVYDDYDHVVDTHTAVAFNVYKRYRNRSQDETKTIIVATASPFKFIDAVADAVFGTGYARGRSTETLLAELAAESGLELPATLAGLAEKPVLHQRLVEKDQMRQATSEVFGLG